MSGLNDLRFFNVGAGWQRLATSVMNILYVGQMKRKHGMGFLARPPEQDGLGSPSHAPQSP